MGKKKKKPRSDKKTGLSMSHGGAVTAKEGRASTGEGRGALGTLAGLQAGFRDGYPPRGGPRAHRRFHNRAAFLRGGCESQ